jgi:hypothetical protein
MTGTRDAAAMLGVRPGTLLKAIWEGRLPEPQRGPGKAFIWSENDLRRAAWLLCHQDLDTVLAERRAQADGGPHHV